MTFAIANTDLDWFEALRSTDSNRFVNFWTPTPWNVTGLNKGEHWYFMLKSPVRKVGGFGLFHEYREMQASEAWHYFGSANGVLDRSELVSRIQAYASKRSSNFANVRDPVIGCVVLADPMFYDDSEFFSPNDVGLSFARQIVKFKYFDGDGIALGAGGTDQTTSFQLINAGVGRKKVVPVKDRSGQPAFRRSVLLAYRYQCAITGTTVPQVLEAAHIQPYIDPRSNHIQNGLCLRVDLHRLFDQGLIAIGADFSVLISTQIKESANEYSQLGGLALGLPADQSNHPSRDALQVHRDEIFLG
ncbi:MAG: hypothetical protein CL566_02005 [Alphaproteobacteria bacterium]|nr:hypothetical protein [Alphaproteobacteria bacterium]|tara:strand:- start:705 stop:1610 length:906 start_codon:yes stop_codon:yes gene_type:complete